MKDEEGEKIRKQWSEYVQMKWRKKSWKRWWYNLQKWEKGKKRKEYLPSLIDDLPGNLLQVLPFYFGGVQRIDHKLELGPRAHYIVKYIKNEVIRILRRRTSSWSIVGTHKGFCILILLYCLQKQWKKGGGYIGVTLNISLSLLLTWIFI